jgi:hypothetical protein
MQNEMMFELHSAWQFVAQSDRLYSTSLKNEYQIIAEPSICQNKNATAFMSESRLTLHTPFMYQIPNRDKHGPLVVDRLR